MLHYYFTTIHSPAYARAMIEEYRFRTEHPKGCSLFVRVSSEKPVPGTPVSKITISDSCTYILFYPYRIDENGQYKVNRLLNELKAWLVVEDLQSLPTQVMITVTGAHNLAPVQVEELRYLADLDASASLKAKQAQYVVACYGLRTTSDTRLYPGARKLMELADTVESIPINCSCGRPAVFNYDTGHSEEPLCAACYYNRTIGAGIDDAFMRVAKEDAYEYIQAVVRQREESPSWQKKK